MARRRDKDLERRIALSRIERLLGLARRESQGPDADLADRYAELALRIARRYQITLQAPQKAQVCRACHAYRVPGRTSRARIQNGRVVTTCVQCGDVRRRPLAARRETASARATGRPEGAHDHVSSAADTGARMEKDDKGGRTAARGAAAASDASPSGTKQAAGDAGPASGQRQPVPGAGTAAGDGRRSGSGDDHRRNRRRITVGKT